MKSKGKKMPGRRVPFVTADEYTSWKRPFVALLEDMKPLSKMTVFNHHSTSAVPGLEIDGRPAIQLPLSPHDAEIIKDICKRNPIGKVGKPGIYTPVGDFWELEPTRFRLVNSEWAGFLQRVLQEAVDGLGLTNATIIPHRLLLQEEGSFFMRSEREPNVVARLLVCLPSQHEGGDIHVRFGPDHRVFSTSPTSTSDVTAFGWPSGVGLEVYKLTSGYRLTLAYNVVQSGPVQTTGAFFSRKARKIREEVGVWNRKFKLVDVLVCPLDGKYPTSSLSLQDMKGRDRIVCQALKEAASAYDNVLLFAHQMPYENVHEPQDIYLNAVFTSEGKLIARGIHIAIHQSLANVQLKGRGKTEIEAKPASSDGKDRPASYHRHGTLVLLAKKKGLRYYCLEQAILEDDTEHAETIAALVATAVGEQPENEKPDSRAVKFMQWAMRTPGGKSAEQSTFCRVAYWTLQLGAMDVFQEAADMADRKGMNLYSMALETLHDKPGWIISCLLPSLTSWGSRGLIQDVMNTVFSKRNQPEFSNAKDIFTAITESETGLDTLILNQIDLRCIYPIRRGDCFTGVDLVDHLRKFVRYIDQGLMLGAVKPALNLLEETCSDLLVDLHPDSNLNDLIVEHLLLPLAALIQKHNLAVTQPTVDFFETIIKVFHKAEVPDLPLEPPDEPDYSDEVEPASRCGCQDCATFSAFLACPEENIWDYCVGSRSRRDHMNVIIHDSLFNLEIMTNHYFCPPEITVRKMDYGRYVRDCKMLREGVPRLATILLPLETDSVKAILGEERYDDLILLNTVRAQERLLAAKPTMAELLVKVEPSVKVEPPEAVEPPVTVEPSKKVAGAKRKAGNDAAGQPVTARKRTQLEIWLNI